MTKAPFSKLNIKQQAFVEAYVQHGNGTKAATAAGYAAGSAHVTASKLLKVTKVREAIDAIRAERWKSAAMGKDEWLALVSHGARNPLADVLHIGPEGEAMIDLSRASADTLAQIKEIKIEDFIDKREVDEEGNPIAREVRSITLKMADPVKQREIVGRHLGELNPKAGDAIADFASVMAEAMGRAKRGNRDEESG